MLGRNVWPKNLCSLLGILLTYCSEQETWYDPDYDEICTLEKLPKDRLRKPKQSTKTKAQTFQSRRKSKASTAPTVHRHEARPWRVLPCKPRICALDGWTDCAATRYICRGGDYDDKLAGSRAECFQFRSDMDLTEHLFWRVESNATAGRLQY